MTFKILCKPFQSPKRWGAIFIRWFDFFCSQFSFNQNQFLLRRKKGYSLKVNKTKRCELEMHLFLNRRIFLWFVLGCLNGLVQQQQHDLCRFKRRLSQFLPLQVGIIQQRHKWVKWVRIGSQSGAFYWGIKHRWAWEKKKEIDQYSKCSEAKKKSNVRLKRGNRTIMARSIGLL